ncbi:hypothetical protein CMI48_04545 [Candidatus Pacearchaeota archaeon]|nr:hypothetical protein [Candidatus Pacearchaeota archaeon]
MQANSFTEFAAQKFSTVRKLLVLEEISDFFAVSIGVVRNGLYIKLAVSSQVLCLITIMYKKDIRRE